MTPASLTSALEPSARGQAGPPGLDVTTPRARAGQPAATPEQRERLAPLATRSRQLLGELDVAVRSTNLLSLGADLDAALRDEPAAQQGATRAPADDAVVILGVLGTLQSDTTQAVVGMDGVVSILQDLDHRIRCAAGPLEEVAASSTAPAAPACDVVRTPDGAARALATQSEAFLAIAASLDLARALAEELVQDSELLAPAFGVEPAQLAEAGARTALAAQVTAICFAHLGWRNELVRGVASRTVPAVEIDPTRCTLGRWLDHHEPLSGEESALLGTIRPLHERFHRAAVGILDDIRRGASVHEVLGVVDREVAPCFAETWACLIQLVGMYQAIADVAVANLRR